MTLVLVADMFQIRSFSGSVLLDRCIDCNRSAHISGPICIELNTSWLQHFFYLVETLIL